MPALVAASAGLKPSLDAGERAFQKCYSCHSITGDERLEGPRLSGIAGGPVAARTGFDYSPAMKRFANKHPVWTDALLDRFIADPEAVVPGTSMAFAGVRDANERAQLIAYLRGVPDSGS
ncbi:MAG TPA: c-type cytochrome [Sphingomicrobium sp.]|nr:c-type cytochrome [Sphingomicrobium sp.]